MAYNDYEKLDPYYQYGDPEDPSPYELLNQMKSWDKAIRLTVTALSEETQAQLTVLDDRITAEVTDVTQDMNTAIGVLNGAISLKITKGEAITDINVTPGLVKIRADKLALEAYATFTALGQPGMTSIHGGNIITGTIVADKIGANQISVNHLQTNSISADKVQFGAINTNHLQANSVSAYHIQTSAVAADEIAAGAVSAGKIASYAIQAYHLNAGIITAEHIYASGLTADIIKGGTITSSVINVGTDVTVGRNLYIGTHYGNSEEKSIVFGGSTGGVIRHRNDRLYLSSFYGVDINGDLNVTGNYGNVCKTRSNGIEIDVVGKMLRVYSNGAGVGSVALT